jgi:hypothetical protein
MLGRPLASAMRELTAGLWRFLDDCLDFVKWVLKHVVQEKDGPLDG